MGKSGVTGDPRRRVLARIESEPIPFGEWSALFDALAEAAIDFGVCIGGSVVDCAEDGWEPAPGAVPEAPLKSTGPATWDLVRLTLEVAAGGSMRCRLTGADAAVILARVAGLEARVSELENEVCARDGATDVAVAEAVSRAERQVDDLLAGREVDPAALNAMLARRFLRILNLRTSELADALDAVARRDRAICEAGRVLDAVPWRSEAAEALRLLRGALGEADQPSTFKEGE